MVRATSCRTLAWPMPRGRECQPCNSLRAVTFDAETERLLSLGAQRLRDVQRDKSRWTTFADIEGNEFDLIAG